MKKGQIYEGYVERLDFPNKGIVRCGDEIVVVKNTLPGQRISFMVNKKRKGKAEGRLLEVLERAEGEIESPCPHFGACGGCSYQRLPYAKQLEITEEQVLRLLRPMFGKQMLLKGEGEDLDAYIGGIFEGIKPSPVQTDYRTKWSFRLEMNIRTGRLRWGCISGEAFMISYLSGIVALSMRITEWCFLVYLRILQKETVVIFTGYATRDI